ncbi:MAG: hypothetical protein K8U57_29070 [Planctomycetes bacterium]|nr:hypothetical protein [Planctomycetota bacterium]
MTATTTPQTRGLRLPVLGTLLHAGFVFGLLVAYMSYVPDAKRTCDEFGLTLPWLTQTTFKLSMWVSDYWWTLVPVFAVFGVLDFVTIWWLGESGRFSQKAWIVGVALLLGAIGTTTAVAIELPMMKLREGLKN